MKRIEELIKAQEDVTSDVLKSALEKQIKKEQEAQEKRILGQFEKAKLVLDNSVEELRSIRKMEKTAEKKVKALDAAFEQFKKDGNWDTYRKSVSNYTYL